jgi:riboflavin synthase
MFTGIVQEIGTVIKIKENRGCEITIKAKSVLNNIHYGDSIAVNGVCQTVTSFNENSFTFFSMAETLEITTMPNLTVGSLVNLEPSLTISSLLGGHILMGHIDGVGEISSIKPQQNSTLYSVKIPIDIVKYVVKKGSIAIDGISLTVYDIIDNIVTVAIIPTTSKETILSTKKIGDKVNIETDILAKYVEKMLFSKKDWNKEKQEKNELSEDMLRKFGYL